MLPTAFDRLPSARFIDQHLSHRARGNGHEMISVFRGSRRTRELEVGLMDEHCRLQRGVGVLITKLAPRERTQLFVHEGPDLLDGVRLPDLEVRGASLEEAVLALTQTAQPLTRPTTQPLTRPTTQPLTRPTAPTGAPR